MTQKNNILTVVVSICAVLALSACVTEKKKGESTGTYSEQYCIAQMKAYDSLRKVCISPDLTFCATQLQMVRGATSCRAPSSQSDCDVLGSKLGKNLSWKSGKCEQTTGDAGHGKLDSSIRIAWSGKRTVQGAQRAFVDIGSVTITTNKNDIHQINMLKKAGSTCELRKTEAGSRSFKVEAKGPASTCEGKIFVINKKTGNYNVKEFSVTIN